MQQWCNDCTIYCCSVVDSFVLVVEILETTFLYFIFWESLKEFNCSSTGLCYILWTDRRKLKYSRIIIYCSINIVQHFRLVRCYFLIGRFVPGIFLNDAFISEYNLSCRWHINGKLGASVILECVLYKSFYIRYWSMTYSRAKCH